MKILIVALVLSACVRSAVVPQPAPQSRNAAVEYARTIAADARCIPISTTQDGQPDTAICDVEQVLAYCRVGVGAGSQCTAFADLRPRPLEEQAANVEANSQNAEAKAADSPKPPQPAESRRPSKPSPRQERPKK